MRAHSRRGRRWRRFNQKYGVMVFIGILVAAILAVVALLMYMLTSMNWRPRY